METTKTVLSAFAVVLTVLAYVPYCRDIINGKTHPHVYSWSLWEMLTLLIVESQGTVGAGVSSHISLKQVKA
jgi:hypothetical protein